ncbi:MAG: hypothetical protein WCS73_08050 [Lentisphaeria bacterium]
MATKKKIANTPLSFVEIVMRADAETIKAALEARVKVDGLLAEREAAYLKIAELETQVDQLMGDEKVFVFPAPPMPVAAYTNSAHSVSSKRTAATPAKQVLGKKESPVPETHPSPEPNN